MLQASIKASVLQIVQSIAVPLLCLLDSLVARGAVQPERHKRQPTQYCNPDTANPDPRTANLETPWVLVVRKVPHSNLSLLINGGDEGAAVVDAEVEDSVLVGCSKPNTKDSRIRGLRNRREIEALEGREHAEFELDVVLFGGLEGNKAVVFVFGDFDLEVLYAISSCPMGSDQGSTYNIGLDTIDGGIILRNSSASVQLLALTLVLVMKEFANLEHTCLLECPSRQLLRKLAVASGDSLATQLGLLSKPLVL